MGIGRPVIDPDVEPGLDQVPVRRDLPGLAPRLQLLARVPFTHLPPKAGLPELFTVDLAHGQHDVRMGLGETVRCGSRILESADSVEETDREGHHLVP